MTVCVRFAEDSRGDVVDVDYFCSGFCFTAETGDPADGHYWPGGSETDYAVFCAHCGDLMWHGLGSSQHYRDGWAAGNNAASWIDVEGVDGARWLLAGISDGDPEVMDLQPSPLSGEWAGESIPELIAGYADMSPEDQETACDDYEQGFSDAFWRELERRAQSFVAIDGPTLDREGRYRVKGWPAVAVYIIDQYQDRAVVVMVGDDTEHTVDASDLQPIGDDDYCPGCGQIGCNCYGTSEVK